MTAGDIVLADTGYNHEKATPYGTNMLLKEIDILKPGRFRIKTQYYYDQHGTLVNLGDYNVDLYRGGTFIQHIFADPQNPTGTYTSSTDIDLLAGDKVQVYGLSVSTLGYADVYGDWLKVCGGFYDPSYVQIINS